MTTKVHYSGGCILPAIIVVTWAVIIGSLITIINLI